MGWELVGAILSSAIVATVIGWALNAYQERRRQARSRSYWAVVNALNMERYALLCADLLGERADYISSHGQIGNLSTSLPAAPEMDKDTDWQSLPPELVGDIFQFPIEIRLAQEAVQYLSYVADADAAEETCADKAAILGNRSIELSSRLRTNAGLSQIKLVGVNWDYRGMFEERIREAARRGTDRR